MSKKTNTTDDIEMNVNDRRRTIFGLCLASLTVYLTFAFVSYLFTWRIDQSTLDVQLNKLFFNSNIVASNWSGTLGAFLAHRFMYKWIGLPAFAIIVILSVAAMKLLRIKTLPLNRTIKLSIVYALWGSVALGYVFHHAAFAPGGTTGHFVSEWMNAVIGKLGTGIVLLTLLFVILSFTFDSFIERCRQFIKGLFTQKIVETELPIDEDNAPNDSDTQPAESEPATPDNSEDTAPETNREDNNTEDETDNDETDDSLKFKITTTSIEQPSNQQDDESPIGFTFDNLDDVESKLIDNSDEENDYNSNDEENDNSFEIIDTTKRDDLESENEQYEEPNSETEQFEETETDNNGEVTLDVVETPEEESQSAKEIDREEMGPYDPTLDLENYKLPSIDLLNDYEQTNNAVTEDELIANKNKIVETLNDYKIQIDKINATVGPTITLYEIVPAKGIKISKIKNLSDDIALSLAALGIRIIAPIPGKGTIGIEVPNAKPQTVAMRTVLASKRFQESNYELPVAIGKNIQNETFVFDLTKTPHLLVAGRCGQIVGL